MHSWRGLFIFVLRYSAQCLDIGAGVYKPRVRCYETAELAMKFERAMDCETVQFQILSEDWRKVYVGEHGTTSS
jgi:hypothetical protein